MSIFFFKQRTAYEMRISDLSSDVCSSDLIDGRCGYADGFGSGPSEDGRQYRLPKCGWSFLAGAHPLMEGIGADFSAPRSAVAAGPVGTGPCRITAPASRVTLRRKAEREAGNLNHIVQIRSEERRVGKECGSTCRIW